MIYQALCTIGLLPIQLRRNIGSFLGLLFSLIPTREQKIALSHLKAIRVPAPLSVMRSMYQSLGTVFFELLNLKPLLENSDYITPPNSELFDKFHHRSQPIIALTAHLGNWELLGAYFAKNGFDIYTIGRESRMSFVQDILSKFRLRYGLTTIWRGEKHITKKLLKILKGDGIIAALIDQDTDVSSIDIPFLGVTAKTPVALVELGIKTDAIFISTFITRESTGKYKIHLKELSSGQQDAKAILIEYTKHLEELVLTYPEQWVWFHKRWRTKRDGSRLRTKEYIEYIKSVQFKTTL